MKIIKNFNLFLESWSDDYTFDFAERGFKIDQTSNLIKGTYKGKFIQTQLIDDFSTMVGRLSDNYYVLRTKTYFNQTTDNASFEVEVSDKFKEVSDYILIDLSSDEQIKFYPSRVNLISMKVMYVQGRLESGQEREIGILLNDKGDGIKEPYIIPTLAGCSRRLQFMAIIRGYSAKSRKIDKENITKLFSFIDDGKIPNNSYVDRYEEFKKDVLDIFI
jgi:hypothetical protein